MTIEELHDKAMGLSDLGFISQQRGDSSKATSFFSQACKFEAKAALTSAELNIGQPTVGILFRSAGTLAGYVGDISEMLSLTQKAIKTNLLPWQIQEFLELLNDNKIYVESLDEEIINRLIIDNVLSKSNVNKKEPPISNHYYQKKRKKINA